MQGVKQVFCHIENIPQNPNDPSLHAFLQPLEFFNKKVSRVAQRQDVTTPWHDALYFGLNLFSSNLFLVFYLNVFLGGVVTTGHDDT